MTSKNTLMAGALLCLSSSAWALDCEREDIDHYLDRGFTPQQVLELCRPGPAAQAKLAGEADADQQYWEDVIDAKQIQLTGQALSYVRDICLAYDRPNFAEQRKKACGELEVVIPRNGLKVQDSRKKLLFWGENSIEVRSPGLQQEYRLGQQNLPARDQAMIQQEIGDAGVAQLPVRDGVAVDVVEQRLRALALDENAESTGGD